jgi:hypothetical protein
MHRSSLPLSEELTVTTFHFSLLHFLEVMHLRAATRAMCFDTNLRGIYYNPAVLTIRSKQTFPTASTPGIFVPPILFRKNRECICIILRLSERIMHMWCMHFVPIATPSNFICHIFSRIKKSRRKQAANRPQTGFIEFSLALEMREVERKWK